MRHMLKKTNRSVSLNATHQKQMSTFAQVQYKFQELVLCLSISIFRDFVFLIQYISERLLRNIFLHLSVVINLLFILFALSFSLQMV